MATSAFKSTTKRSSIGAAAPDTAASSNRHRRARSLSRPPSSRARSSSFQPSPQEEEYSLPAPPSFDRGKFVNTVRGSSTAFPEISLDDLATQFFPLPFKDYCPNTSTDEGETNQPQHRSRSLRRSSSISGTTNTHTPTAASSQRRGRSVSRHQREQRLPASDANLAAASASASASAGITSSRGKTTLVDNNTRRRRSLSVVARQRHQFTDSEESDVDQSQKSSHLANVKGSDRWNHQSPSLNKPVTLNNQRVLRSLSQKDLSKSRDGYSSHSSALTDDEARDTHSSKNGSERTIRAVYAQKKTDHPTGDGGDTELYDVMRKELRHAVEEIRTELEHGIVKMNHSVLPSDDCPQDVAMIRDNYAAKLEQSEKRKRDLLAEIVAEEQRRHELSKIVNDLLPDPRNTTADKNPSRVPKNTRSLMSKCLTEDAEKYFDGFISNVEDTDISSFDGERSDASSTLGVKKRREPAICLHETEARGPPRQCTTAPVEMDGVVLPWLEWETSNDGTPISCKSKVKVPPTPHDMSYESMQEESPAQVGSNFFTSSHGSWSPGDDNCSVFCRNDLENIICFRGSFQSQDVSKALKDSYFDMDEYLQQSEEIPYEGWRQRQRISSGALILCNRTFLHF